MNLATLRWQLDNLTEDQDPGMEVRLRFWDESQKTFRSVDIRHVALVHNGVDLDDKDMVEMFGGPHIQFVADEHLDEFGNELYYLHDRQAA